MTGQGLPGIMYVDKNSNMTYDFRDKFAYFKPISYQRALYATLQHPCMLSSKLQESCKTNTIHISLQTFIDFSKESWKILIFETYFDYSNAWYLVNNSNIYGNILIDFYLFSLSFRNEHNIRRIISGKLWTHTAINSFSRNEFFLSHIIQKQGNARIRTFF